MAMNESYEAVELKEFQTQLYNRMNEFRQKNHLCDVNINVNGTLHPCHRLILTAASPFFETCLADNTVQTSDSELPVLKIDEVEGTALEEILNAIYSSRLRLLPKNVYFILKASHFLQLDVIKKACVAWIMKNTDVHYLIDVCLFAKSIEEESLYQQCVNYISLDVRRWGKTDSFKDIPFDILKYILSYCDTSKIEEIALLMIIKWSKHNKVNSANVQALLDSAKLKGKIVSTSIMSELIINSDEDVFTVEKARTTAERMEQNSHFDFNLYVNSVDVKTGVKGWGIMKINETFEESIMSNFFVENSKYKKIVKVGTKHFCYELKNDGKNAFSCFDEYYNKTALDLPNSYAYSTFDLVPAHNIVIYLLRTGSSSANDDIWAYECASSAWKKVFEQKIENQQQKPATSCGYCNNCRRGCSYSYCTNRSRLVQYETYTEMKPALLNYKNHSCAFVSSDGILYVITKDSNNNSVILLFDSRSPTAALVLTYITFQHQNAAVCMFDNKIAFSGSDDGDVLSNSLNIYDITAKKWLPDIKPMNFSRANHNLFHHDGFLYAVENDRPLIPNEKYDLKLNEWTDVPALPKRILVDNVNEVTVVSTADVFGVHVNPTQ